MRRMSKRAWAAVTPRWLAATVAVACLLIGGQAAGAALPAGDSGPLRVARWTTAEGLPQNSVNAIAVLSDGELWLATFGGLGRFDGHSFTVLDIAADDTLPSNRIVALVREGADSFLFLTQPGHLGRVTHGRVERLLDPPPSTVDMLGLVADHAGTLYARATDGRLWQSDGTHAWTPLFGGRPAAFDFVADAHGDVWAATDEGFRRLSAGAAYAQASLPARDFKVFARRQGGFWLGLQRLIGRLDGVALTMLDVRPPFESAVEAVQEEGDDAMWVGSTGGVSRLERQPDGTWRRTPVPLDLQADQAIRALSVDARGSLWVGTLGGGLHRVSRLPTRRFGAESGLTQISAVADDGQGGAFVSHGCQRLAHISAAGVVRQVALPPPVGFGNPGGCGIPLATRPDGAWARVGARLFAVARDTLDARQVAGDLPVEEGPLVANADRTVWVASRSGVVRLVSSEGRTVRELAVPAPIVYATATARDLWIGGDARVIRVSGSVTTEWSAADGVPRGLVREIVVEDGDTAWIGTYGGGLGRLEGRTVTRLTAAQGLPDNSISRILPDGRGRMWVSTNRGVAVVETADLQRLAHGLVRTVPFVVFGRERGVDEANYGFPAGFAAKDGRLWFGTISSVAVIDGAAFPFNRTPPRLRVDEVRADDRPLPAGELLRAPAGTARLRLTLSTGDLLYAEQMRFRFRVEGVDSDWVDAGTTRTVDWSPPAPGLHRILLAARNEDGIWSDPTAIEVDVLPAWWQTTAFTVSLGVTLTALLLGAFSWRVRDIERAHAARLQTLEDQRQVEERLGAMRAQLEHVSRAALAGELAAGLAHEVRQPINAMMLNAETSRRFLPRYLDHPDELRQMLDDIVADGKRVSEVIRGLRSFLQPTPPGAATVNLSALVREVLPLVRREIETHQVTLDLELADDLPAIVGFPVQLGQVVVNLVINACEALAEIEGPRIITVSTAAGPGTVELRVCDTGPGLHADVAPRLFQPFTTTKPGGLGVGLAICRSIAESHGGQLVAMPRDGSGLCVALTLPTGPRLEGRGQEGAD